MSITKSIPSSIEKFTSSELLEGDDSWFCFGCQELRESIRNTSFITSGKILIIQLKRFSCANGTVKKDNRHLEYDNTFSVKVPYGSEGEVSFFQAFELRAVINHSGTLNAGHYWSTTFNPKLHSWLWCDDKSVKRVAKRNINLQHAYVLFYEKI